jgi:hypothetical protein
VPAQPSGRSESIDVVRRTERGARDGVTCAGAFGPPCRMPASPAVNPARTRASESGTSCTAVLYHVAGRVSFAAAARRIDVIDAPLHVRREAMRRQGEHGDSRCGSRTARRRQNC